MKSRKREGAAGALRCDREEQELSAAAERHPEENSAPLSAHRGAGEGWGFKSVVSGNLKGDSMCERSQPGKTETHSCCFRSFVIIPRNSGRNTNRYEKVILTKVNVFAWEIKSLSAVNIKICIKFYSAVDRWACKIRLVSFSYKEHTVAEAPQLMRPGCLGKDVRSVYFQ